jgi:hypothetical protein
LQEEGQEEGREEIRGKKKGKNKERGITAGGGQIEDQGEGSCKMKSRTGGGQDRRVHCKKDRRVLVLVAEQQEEGPEEGQRGKRRGRQKKKLKRARISGRGRGKER